MDRNENKTMSLTPPKKQKISLLRIGKIVLTISSIVFLCLFITMIVLFGRIQNHWDSDAFEAQIIQELKNDGAQVSLCENTEKCPGLRTLSIGNPELPTTVFVHGGMNRWQATVRQIQNFQSFKRHHIILFDRPGYGQSAAPMTTDILEQAELIAPMIQQIEGPVRLAGYSYGGAIALTIAEILPEQVDTVQLISAVVTPEHDVSIWGIDFWASQFMKSIFPDPVWTGLKEVQDHQRALNAAMPQWENITIPVSAWHGTDDDLAPTENLSYVEKVLPNASVTTEWLPNTGHSVFFAPQQIVIPKLFP